ncbi:fumarylacetoacetate hydrolase family protein [Hydrogenophaga sp.]|jgi:acylpyruvate hydrolase|uniref:fumarylacetoacetate hydrolase family protein n=1 Tax=Hydrogenophaga sp. TaxID=1904254 RepID=UPI003F723EB4
MRFVSFKPKDSDHAGLAIQTSSGLLALPYANTRGVPQDLKVLIENGPAAMREVHALIEQHGEPVLIDTVDFLPPVTAPGKILCVGLNYRDHTKESNFEQPAYPTLFLRVPGSLVGHEQAIVRPACSEQLDYEGELAAFIGKGGKHISRESALDHVAGYATSNEGCVRDYQFKSPQWTMGKNFDRSGSIGPEFVSADELPPGAVGLAISTRLNGQIVQSANTSEMVFDLATVISLASEVMTLAPGDVILTGTPAGVGFARNPQLFLRDGDVIEVEIERVGLLRNRVADEGNRMAATPHA